MFTPDQLVSILKGAAVAALGATLTAAEHTVAGWPLGAFLTPALTAVNSIIVNAARKYFFG